MQLWLTGSALFFIFAGISIVAFGVQFWWLRRQKIYRLPWKIWLGASVLLLVSWQMSEQSGRYEFNHVQRLTQDFALLYADDLERLGHWKLSSSAATNDPLYLDLIQTEIRWEKLNPDVADIYTLRKRADGKNIFIVDSETDYNQDGDYEQEKEQRTPIGEVYDEPDNGLEQAFRGTANFDIVPITDRWGTWISAFVPLHDPSGKFDGVVGVDFDASKFLDAIIMAKLRILSLFALVQLTLLGSSTLFLVQRAQNTRRKRLIAELQTALAEVKTLSGLIPICGWCKKMRNDEGYWSSVENYLRAHTDAKFTHGVCPDCLKKLEEEIARNKPKGSTSTK